LIGLTKTFNTTTMDIDSFYQDGDMSFGMDGRINFADEYAYARGSSGPSRADQVASAYPITDNCVTLENSIASIETEIANNNQKSGNPKTKRGEKRVLNDYNNLLTSHKAKMESAYKAGNCQILKTQAQDQSFLSQLSQTVGASANPLKGGTAGAGTTGKDKTMTYVLYGLGGLMVLGLGIIVIKKMRG
jgi:hypothetical protein